MVMHGQRPGSALLRNVEVSSMGGLVECGVGLDMKTSPRRAAIEKAQTELRKEYDVREERRRELEFLEKGGNPLDFKFGHAASTAVQSTLLTAQQAEQPMTSEAKGGTTLAASPHGDSVGSSGRLGMSFGREPNIADNLSILDGEDSHPGVEKNVMHAGKRGNISLPEQSSAADGCANAKETEDSLIFHLGVKSQAYTRRNRSRTNRDSHNNKSTLPYSIPDRRDGNRLTLDAQADNHEISSVSNSKQEIPDGDVASRAPASDVQSDLEPGGVQAHHTHVEMIKDEARDGEVEAKISEGMKETDHSSQSIAAPGKQPAHIIFCKSSDLHGKDEATSVAPCLVSVEPTVNIEDAGTAERVGSSFPYDKEMTDVMDDDVTGKKRVAGDIEVLSLTNKKRDTSHANRENDATGGGNNESYGKLSSNEVRTSVDPREGSVTSDNSALREKSLMISVKAPIIDDEQSQASPSIPTNSIVHVKDEVDLCENRSDIPDVHGLFDTGNLKTNADEKPERKTDDSLLDSSHSINKAGIITSSLVVPNCDPSATAFLKKDATSTLAVQNNAGSHLKSAKKAQEDAILKEARIIEIKLRRAGQLSASHKPSEKRQKCHWDFVLEEMKWMANDFFQERLWKISAAAYIGHWIVSSGRSKFEHEMISKKQRDIARTLARAVMLFWQSVDVCQTTGLTREDHTGECNSNLLKSCKANGTAAEKNQDGKCIEAEKIGLHRGIQAYAVRFLKHDCNASNQPLLVNGPTTPDRINDAGMPEASWEDDFSDEDLFYRIPPGAMQVYREAVESHWMNYKKKSTSVQQKDCEAIPCDSAPGGHQDNEYEEEEGETGSYVLPGKFEGAMSPKLTQKQRKYLQQKSSASRLYNVVTDLSYEPFLEGKSANQALSFTGKRPSSTVHAGQIPTKRVRTAARQRVVNPFSAAATGNLQVSNKTDASSGDTNSLQDDQSSMHGGSQSWRNMELESTADYEAQFPFDSSEISTKSKAKKFKHLGLSCHSDSGVAVSGKGSILDPRLLADSFQHEQRDQVKKRLESESFESNGKLGTYGQHAAKRPKLLKRPMEPSPEAMTPAAGSMPSPVTSQMSYMSNQNKLIKIITKGDRGRKNKALKISARQSGSGISWTTFEDQALVVLVHDMGPNWELVSDAINSTLQFKCIFRKPKECKERHKVLMDKSSVDGADSIEDSGSSQPYPSTLPGIPKGSAIQLFQRLQGPMEEDILKSHFEKIISIGQQLPYFRAQKNLQLKQRTSVHSSHDVALSQTYPNNLTGGVLLPLDLCDAISSNPDVLTLGYQGPHAGSPSLPNHPNNQGYLSSVPSNSSANTGLVGSSGLALGSNSSPSTSLNTPARDAQRHCMQRATSLPIDDQQRLHYTQMISSRNQQSSMSVPGSFLPLGVDRGAYMLPSGNGMGMMGSRTMPMSRPGFQGINSPGMPMVSAGGMLASGGAGMPNPADSHSVAVSGPGNSMSRPHDALPVMRPGQITEDHRQMMMQDLQPQISQGNTPMMPSFGAMNVPFSTGTGLASIQSYPAQQHQLSHQKPRQPHVLGSQQPSHLQGVQGINSPNPHQQAYAMRFAKGRELHQRMGPHPQQSYSPSNAMPLVHSNTQLQQQTQPSSCATMTPSQTQHNKTQVMHNAQSGMPNQVIKQRQRQHAQQQQPRHQHQQKQPGQQQTKVVKGLNRGPTLVHQNISGPSQASGPPPPPVKQVSEKDLIQQGQGFFHASSSLKSTLPQSSNHHKPYSHPSSQTSKQIPQVPSHPDSCSQTPMLASQNQTLPSTQQPARPSLIPLATPLQQQQQQRQINQNTQRIMLQQNRQLTADGRIQSSGDQSQKGNQMIPAASFPRCTDSVNSAPLVSSAAKWKQEPLYDSNAIAPAAQSTSSSGEKLVQTELPPPKEGAEQRQLSGSVSMDGHGVGGQWLSQLPQPQPQLQEQQQQPQHLYQQAVQGGLFARPSNSGPS